MTIDNLTIRRGDTWSEQLLGLGNITGFTDIWMTAKDEYSDTDTQAIIGLQQTVGLVTLNGAAATAGWGSITVDNAANGDITLALTADATSELSPTTYMYDIQVLLAGEVTTLKVANVTISGDVTRATS